ncbi:MAG: hypothetical protein D3906_02080 [Candidatus Electrothrix sp. AUS1_2]|nr:hypothetical protein [Candidatus Electrothrix sp. AUS1_2]
MITILESNDVVPKNPELKRLADDIVNQMKLAVDKVTLNHFEPDVFSIHAEQIVNFEKSFSRLFKILPEEKKRQAYGGAKNRISSSTEERRKYFGRFAEIDIRKAQPVEHLVANLHLPAERISLEDIISESNREIRRRVPALVSPNKTFRNKPIHIEVKSPVLGAIVASQKKISDKHKAMGGNAGVLGKQKEFHGTWALYEGGAIFLNGNGTAFEVHGAIWSKYNALGKEKSFLGLPETDELTTPDTKGRYNHFQGGSIYWHPETGAHEVHGAIRERWEKLGWEKSVLGYPITDESTTPDKTGRYNHFQHGSIYWSPQTGAHEVHGAIRERWEKLGWEKSSLGYPVTDELTASDTKGRYNHFQGGSIYWHPDIGTHEVHGAICERWEKLGWEKSVLGYPITDELTTPDGIGRYNHFQHGSIYWSPQTGAHEVHGAIRGLWESLGWEKSSLGYPVTDELPLQDGGRYNRFQGGEIHWYPNRGAFLASFMPFNTLTLRCVKLYCEKETSWDNGTSSDEMRMAGTLFEINPTGEKGYSFGQVDLEDDWDDNNWNCWTSPRHLISVPINQNNSWPKGFIATCMLIESDHGGAAEVIQKMLDELRPVVKKKAKEALLEAGIAAGTELGSPELGAILGKIAGELSAYVLDEIFDWIKSWWNDNFFAPFSFSIQLPDNQALFGSGTLNSAEEYWICTGFGAKYHCWLDWALS